MSKMSAELEKRLDAKLTEIFKEIDKEMPKEHYENEGFHHKEEDCLLCWWQALKAKYLRSSTLLRKDKL